MRLEKICQQIGRWQPTLYRKKKRKSLERQIQAVLCSFEWWPMLPPPMNMNWAHKKMLWWPNDLRVVKVALNSNDEWQSSEVNAIWKYTVWEDDSNEQLTNCENVTYMRQGSMDLIGIYIYQYNFLIYELLRCMCSVLVGNTMLRLQIDSGRVWSVIKNRNIDKEYLHCPMPVQIRTNVCSTLIKRVQNQILGKW